MQGGLQGSEASSDERAAGTGAVVVVALIGALLVLVAQFVALYYVRVATSSTPVKTVTTGANHGWAPLPIALVCLALVLAVFRHGNRTALLGLGVLGVATLVIALAADLPDVHATGLVGSSAGQFQRAANSPAAGLYLETLGSVLLLVSGGVGFLMLGGVALRIAWPARIARPTIGRHARPAAAPDAPARSAPDAAAVGVRDAPTRRARDTRARAATDTPAPAATEPVVSPPEPGSDDRESPGATPPGDKGPLSLRDSQRRRWSAS